MKGRQEGGRGGEGRGRVTGLDQNAFQAETSVDFIYWYMLGRAVAHTKC